MVGKIFTDDRYTQDNEFIVVEELNNVLALQHTITQTIVWVTRNTLLAKYTEKGKDSNARVSD